ncbi:MAG: ABC transporter permease [Candidatus Bathyarchaeia archaeon]
MNEEIISFVFLISFLESGIRLAIPILLAAIGELFAERSGILNLGVEGIMLMGSFIGFNVALSTGDLWLGIMAGILTGVIMGMFMAFMSVTLRVNQVICGLAVWMVGLGLSSFLFRVTGGHTATARVEGFKALYIPFLSEVPILGPVLFRHTILVYISLILVPISALILFRTTFGLKIRAVGENPRAADALGINVALIRYLCIIFGGIMAGLGGSVLVLTYIKMFTEGMTGGRGWIAIAIVIFGKWNPYKVLVGALLFGLVDAFQLNLQALGTPIPPQFLQMLPYILTILVLVGALGKAGVPLALSKPYSREEK